MKRKPNWKGYADVLLDESAIKAAKADKRSNSQLLDDCIKLLADGYKFSLEYRDEREKYTASLYGATIDCDNAGYMLSIEHSKPHEAMRMLLIQHHDIFNEQWSEKITGDAW